MTTPTTQTSRAECWQAQPVLTLAVMVIAGLLAGLPVQPTTARDAVLMAQASTESAQPTPAWQLRCGTANDAQTCTMNQELLLQRQVDGEQQTVGRLLNLTVLYLGAGGERVPFLSLQMPLGVDLRPGAVMRVDDGPETPLEFLRCTEAGCDASARITPELLQQMRDGSRLRVGFRPWGSEQVTAVDASLIGFTAAFAQLR